MPLLTIDNRKIDVAAGTKVIDAAQQLGIVIPRFCYHPALGSVGACRVCAVAFVDGPVKGIQMSCMVNAMDAMVVSTTDAEAVDFRRHVIEWLMLHHPHDCPVCDEGGHCLLQDTTIAGGHGLRRYEGAKRTYHDQYLGPLVQHEMNRCIQCYRCSRYYQQHTGYRDLGVLGIGSRVYFGRSAPGRLESPFTGNLTDICPTGVYTDKPSRYLGRRWDFQRAPSLCLHCSLGCNLVVSARYRQLARHEARYNREVNGHFICDRGRYAYPYNNAADRPRQALAAGQPVSVAQAVDRARSALQAIAARRAGPCVALAVSQRSSLETLALAKQTCRQNQWAGPAVTQTKRQLANLRIAVSRMMPECAVSLGAVSAAQLVVVFGADPLNEAPMLALSLRQVQRQGGQVWVFDPRAIELPLPFEHRAVHPDALPAVMKALEHAVSGAPRPQDPAAGGPVDVHMDDLNLLARRLTGGRRSVVVCGTDIVDADTIASAADLVKAVNRQDTQSKLFHLLSGANSFAAALAGDAVLSMDAVLEHIESGRISALVVVEKDLWSTYPDRSRLQGALDRLDLLVVLGYIASPLVERADVFIPTQTLYECGGHWINQEGRLQSAEPVMTVGEPIVASGQGDHPPRVLKDQIPGGDPVPAWTALMDLAVDDARSSTGQPEAASKDRLDAAMGAFHPAIDVQDITGPGHQIDFAAAADRIAHAGPDARRQVHSRGEGITLLLVDATFGTEPLSATAPVLQELSAPPEAVMHPSQLHRLGLEPGQDARITTPSGQIVVPVRADHAMAPGTIVVARHHRLEWQRLGTTPITIAEGMVESAS